MYEITETIKDVVLSLIIGICGVILVLIIGICGTVVLLIIGICAKSVYCNFYRWYHKEEDININDLHIDFVPETTDEEKIIVTRKGKNPEVFKYFSDVK